MSSQSEAQPFSGSNTAFVEYDSSNPSPSVAASPYWITSDKQRQRGQAGFTPFVAFCFTVNYVLGTGFLTIPWAFAQGGIVLSTMLLIIVGLLSDMVKDYVLETMARAEAMLDVRMHWKKNPGNVGGVGGDPKGMLVYSPAIMSPKPAIETDELLEQQADLEDVGKGTIDYKSFNPNSNTSKVSSLSGTSTPSNKARMAQKTPTSGTPNQPGGRIIVRHVPPAYLVRDRKFEMNTLCRVFLGKPGLHVFTFFLSLYIFSILWAYTAVFSSAMASVLPILDVDPSAGIVEDNNYTIYAILFGCVVVPLSCLELDEQITVQVLMTLSRFIMVALMAFTSQECADEIKQRMAIAGDLHDEVSIPWVRWSGVPRMLPILVFALIFHHSIPGLAHPVQNKRKLKTVFMSPVLFCVASYILLGVVLCSSFGASLIEQSANLNWKHFHGRHLTQRHQQTANTDVAMDGVASSLPTPTWWSQAISIYIICFPAIDVLSAFPLNAITLGNNMMGAYFGRKMHEVENNRWIQTRFRLLASVPPVIIAIFIRELGVITDYAGTCAFVIGFTIPALMFIESQRIAKKKGFSIMTYYTSFASKIPLAYIVASFGIAMFLYVLTNLIFF